MLALASRALTPLRMAARPAVAARAMATDFSDPLATVAPEHEPPVQLHGVAGRYASVLYRAASEAKAVDGVAADVDALVNHGAFEEFVDWPSKSEADKINELEECLAEVDADGANITDTTANFLAMLIEDGKLKHMNEIARFYSTLCQAARKEVLAKVTSASELSAAQKKALTKALQADVAAGHTVVLETEVDPALMGGLTVNLDDRFMDLSLATKINQTHQQLAQSRA